KRRQDQLGYIERQRKRVELRIERMAAAESARMGRETKADLREINKAQKTARITKRNNRRLHERPSQIIGLDSSDYPTMTPEQRKIWNRWTYRTYAENYHLRQKRWRQ